jgi:transposase InsO family protein
MTIWQMVALDKQAHLTAPHRVWCADIRYLVKIDGRWLYSGLIFDGYSRAIVGAGCVDRQNFAQLVQVFRQAMAQWGGA